MWMIIKIIVIWAMINGMWVVTDPVQSTCQIKICKARCDDEFENLGNQKLETKMPFWLLQCPVRAPGLAQQLHSLNPEACRMWESQDGFGIGISAWVGGSMKRSSEGCFRGPECFFYGFHVYLSQSSERAQNLLLPQEPGEEQCAVLAPGGMSGAGNGAGNGAGVLQTCRAAI